MRSFTRLLAAGRSVMGIKKKPGPYRMNEDNLLPKFSAGQKQAAAGDVDPTAASAAVQRTGDSEDARDTAASGPTQTPHRRWLQRLSNPFRRTPRAAASVRGTARRGKQLVQGELALETLRVVRNDLTDSDADEGMVGQDKGGLGSRRQPMGIVWNRLSARLLRQAVLEFNLVQKERGKLLSQAGPGSGSTPSA